jgi:hypothetical protein
MPPNGTDSKARVCQVVAGVMPIEGAISDLSRYPPVFWAGGLKWTGAKGLRETGEPFVRKVTTPFPCIRLSRQTLVSEIAEFVFVLILAMSTLAGTLMLMNCSIR